jgi:hypothetical protein
VRVIAFVGPSRPAQDPSPERQPIEWRGPAARGDLDALDAAPADVVALIDGVMITGHSPSPTECFRLISRGVRLFGSSSVGALRAVELRNLGMTGYGWIYRRVLDRTITYDDELVSNLDPRTYEAKSVFLANVRFGLHAAIDTGMLHPEAADAAVHALRAIPVAERGHRAVTDALRAVGLCPRAAEYVLDERHNVKKRDAQGLLQAITNGAAS